MLDKCGRRHRPRVSEPLRAAGGAVAFGTAGAAGACSCCPDPDSCAGPARPIGHGTRGVTAWPGGFVSEEATMRHAICAAGALGLCAFLAMAPTPASAVPLGAGTRAAAAAGPGLVEEVRCRRLCTGGGGMTVRRCRVICDPIAVKRVPRRPIPDPGPMRRGPMQRM